MSFSEAELEELRHHFAVFDIDGDGAIQLHELTRIVTEIGHRATEKEIRDMLPAGKESMSFDEFLSMVADIRSGKEGSAFARLYKKAAKAIRIEGYGGSSHSFTDEEKVAFVDHLNTVLGDDPDLANVIPIDPNTMEVFDKVKDGLLLTKLINVAVPHTVDERALNRKAKKNAWQISENHTLCIESAKSIGCRVVNIGPEDLKEGKVHLVLGLLWQIIKIGLLNRINITHHPELVRLLKDGEELADMLRLPPEDILIRWFNYQLDCAGHARRVSNFTSDISDSECYTVLLSQIAPNKECDRSPLDINDTTQRAEAMLQQAAKVDCRKFVVPRDVVRGNQKLNLAFVANLFNTCPALDPLTEEEHVEKCAELLDLDEEGTREERAFRFWIQSLAIEVNNLFEDVRDGYVLLEVFDKISPGIVTWKRVNRVCKNKFKKIENCNYAVELGQSMKFSLVNIGGTDIVDGYKKLILGLVWQMMRHHVLSFLKVPERELIAWANNKVKESGKEASISSFKDKSLRDGKFLVHLCAAIEPRAVDYEYLTPGVTDEEKELNAKYAISVARKLGATLFLLWEDVVEVNPKMLMTFFGGLMALQKK